MKFVPSMSLKMVTEKLAAMHSSLPDKVRVASIFDANVIAGKWQAPYRSRVLREITFYRTYDLLRISTTPGLSPIVRKLVIRATLETIALLNYLNMVTEKTVDGTLDYFEFEDTTIRLTLGSKTVENFPVLINVNNLIQEMTEKVPNVGSIYDELCEYAHPKYSGFIDSYSRANLGAYETIFGLFDSIEDTDRDLKLICNCIDHFIDEYNNVWLEKFNGLLKWLESNDAKLEKRRAKLIAKAKAKMEGNPDE